jgi:uncharacterized SAM-binding protein YcdF (DUF218 family)
LVWAAVAALIATVVLRDAGRALVVTETVRDADAIIMLASHEWERLPATAAAARRHPNAVVLITVPREPSYWNCFRCSDRVDWLSREGVAPTRVQELGGVANTYEEACAVRAAVLARGLKRVVIITSPYHARRALMTFRTVLRDTDVAIGLEPAIAQSNATPQAWWKYDTDRGYVAYEWAAIAFYAIRYGVRPF